MTMPVAVITDSTACLPPGLASNWDVTVVGMQVSVNGSADDEDRVPISGLVDAMRRNVPVSTSPPEPGAFYWAYSEAISRGARGIVSVHLSAELSETVRVARAAADDRWPVPVRVVDSRTVGMSLGFTALTAARIAETGANPETVRQVARRCSTQCAELLYVDTLEYLRRGKRIGPAAAFLGTAFAVKPVLRVARGQLEPSSNSLGSGRGVRRLIDSAVRHAGNRKVDIAVEYFDSDEHIPEIRGQLEARVPRLNELVSARVTSVLGAHAGPGALGISVCPR